MKKKVLVLALTLSLVAITALGVTLAYFTDTKAVNNTFTMGNVKIALEEIVGYENDVPITTNEGHNYPTVVPGDTLVKKPIVTNTGSNSAWVFLKLTLSDAAAFNELLPSLQGAVEAGVIDFNSTDWTFLSNKVEGDTRVIWIAYKTALASGATTEAPFEFITIPTSWTNEDVATLGEDGFSLTVEAHAIQMQNLTLDQAFAQVNPQSNPV